MRELRRTQRIRRTQKISHATISKFSKFSNLSKEQQKKRGVAMEKEIDLKVLEKAVVEATGSKATGRFAKLTFEAAMNLRAGLSREQTQSAMLSHQANGRRMSARLPYGWKADPDDPARMIPCPYELEIIEKIQAFRQEGLSLRKIVKRLTDLEYQPRKVNRLFKGRTVQVKGTWRHGLIRKILSRIELDLHE